MDKANCVLAQFDIELSTWFQAQHGGVLLTNKEVSIVLHLGM